MSEREEDRGLASEQFEELNRRFYNNKSGPHRYIRNRARALVLAHSDSELITQAERDGFMIGTLSIKSAGDETDEADAQDRENFLVTESSVLLHHAAEALLRLYFAHSGVPECPWLETARLRSFQVFKQRVDALDQFLKQPAAIADVMDVFTGWPNFEAAADGITQDRWDEHQAGLLRLLRTAARVLLDDANLYNAAKHGLAVLPGRASMSVGPGDLPTLDDADNFAVLSTEGESIHYLQATSGTDGMRWRETTRWISAEYNLALVHLISKQIESLLKVGRARYLQDPSGWRVEGITTAMLDRIAAAAQGTSTLGVQSASMSLLYYARSPGTGESEPPTKSKP